MSESFDRLAEYLGGLSQSPGQRGRLRQEEISGPEMGAVIESLMLRSAFLPFRASSRRMWLPMIPRKPGPRSPRVVTWH